MRSASAEQVLFLVSYNTLANNRGGKRIVCLRASYRIDTRPTRVTIRFLRSSARSCVDSVARSRDFVHSTNKLPSILEDARR